MGFPLSLPVSLVSGICRIIVCAALRLSVHSLKGSAMFSCKDLTMRHELISDSLI
ncbi:MAG: hypothetical protein ACQESU_04235 [Halobacteriota archaeon]